MTEAGILSTIGEAIVIGGAGLAAYVSLRERITRVETRLEDFMDNLARSAARALHSPDDHLGIDLRLDRFLKHYNENNFDLPFEEWQELREVCEFVIRKKNASPGEKGIAAVLSAICSHKMTPHLMNRKRNEVS